MSRSAPQILHEIDYWQLLLQDLLAVNDIIGEAAGALLEAPVHLVFAGVTHPDVQGVAEIDEAMVAVKKGMEAIQRMQEPVQRILDLAEGRAQSLDAEIDSGISGSSD